MKKKEGEKKQIDLKKDLVFSWIILKIQKLLSPINTNLFYDRELTLKNL